MNSKHTKNDLVVSLKILNQIGASILSELTIEEMIDTVYHHVNELMDAYSFAIGLYNPSTGRIEYTGARENDQKLPFFSAEANNPQRFSGWVFTHRAEILINDFEKEYRRYIPYMVPAMQGMEPASLMYVPIFSHREMVGILSVRTPEKQAYSEQSLEILKTLSVFIGKAFENSKHPELRGTAKKQLPAGYLADPLSSRELEVLHLLAKGSTNRAIAGELFISPSTVKTHTLNIYQKLEAANRTEAIVRARDYGLIV